MINLNPAIEQKINQFILKVKLAHQKEATNITKETQNLRDELNQKLGELTFSDPLPSKEELEKQIIAHTDQLVETINLLSTGKISETPLDTLSKETDSLVATITSLFDTNANVPNLPKLKEKLTAWQSKVKDNFAQLQEASVLFKNLDDLINEIKARDEGIKLNQRIDILLEKTKEQVAGFPPELDREVQGELAKLIKILGIAQVELMNISKPCDIMQVKAVVDAGEIAIKSLTGQPNIILAQKLRYAAKTGLRKIKKYRGSFLVDFRDNLFHSIKIPTKVLIGLVLALPLNWFIIDKTPVNELLFSLPPIVQQQPDSPIDPQQPAPGNASFPRISKEAKKFIILILMTGTLGGAVSLLTRLQDFDNPKNQKYDDDLLPFIIGLTKPILGGSFAFFILLILNSNISPLEIRGGTENNRNGIYLYGLLTMAFVAGFSERLVPDLISQVEKKVTVEASSTGQGLPRAILIDPPGADLALNGEKEFTINPVGKYTITISPPESGKIDKNTTDAKFTYTAPPQGNAGDKITITATSDSGQTAKATVTLTA